MNNPIVLHSILKQKASQLQKEKNIKWHAALDEASRAFGYANYKNYKNLLDAKRCHSKSSKHALIENIYAENDIFKKIELAVPFIQNHKVQFQDLFDILKLFQHSPDGMQFLCEKSILKTEIQNYLFNDFLSDEGKAEIQSRQDYFVAKEISLSDLTYEIEDGMLSIEGHYVLKTEFEFELDHDDPISKDPRFNDGELFGSFGITIDRNKNINIEHSDIGEEFDGFYQSASFR